MNNSNKEIIDIAVDNKQVLEFSYNNTARIVEPYVVGNTKNKLTLLAIQIGGHSQSGQLPDWRMFECAKIKNIKVRKKRFAAHFEIYQHERKQYDVLTKALNFDEKFLIYLQGCFKASTNYYNDKPYWYAKDIQKLFNYHNRKSFLSIIKKAEQAVTKVSQSNIQEHFRPTDQDLALTSFACLAIAQNADYRKQEIIFACIYFTAQLNEENNNQENAETLEHIKARMQLAETERYLSKTLFEHGINEKEFGRIRSAGDSRLFGGVNTIKMKERFEIRKSQALADHLPTVSIKAKEFAAALTNYKIYNDNINGFYDISNEHKLNNTLIRKVLIKKNIYPEQLSISNKRD